MHRLPFLGSVVLTLFAITGCSGATPTTPTTFSSSSGFGLRVSPSRLVAQPVGEFGCPAVPQFDVPFHLLIDTTDFSLVVTNISARFVDANGMTMPPVTLPAPVPTTTFGTALTAARDLPLSFGLGCGVGHTGTLTLIVTMIDGHGHAGSTQLSAAVN